MLHGDALWVWEAGLGWFFGMRTCGVLIKWCIYGYSVHLHVCSVYICVYIEIVQTLRETWGKSIKKGISDEGSAGGSSLALKMIPGKAQGSRCLSHHAEPCSLKIRIR